jgi:hypothetical protein
MRTSVVCRLAKPWSSAQIEISVASNRERSGLSRLSRAVEATAWCARRTLQLDLPGVHAPLPRGSSWRAEGGGSIPSKRAAAVGWWRVYRAHRQEVRVTEDDLTAALGDLCSCVYSVPPNAVRPGGPPPRNRHGLSDDLVAA